MSRAPVPWNGDLGAAPVAVVAALIGVGEREVQRLVADGVLTRARWGRYDLHDIVRAWVRYEKAGRDRDVAHATARRPLAPPRPLPRTMLEAVLSGIPRSVTAAFRGLPDALAADLAGSTDPDAVRGMLAQALAVARTDAVRRLLHLIGEAEDAEAEASG